MKRGKHGLRPAGAVPSVRRPGGSLGESRKGPPGLGNVAGECAVPLGVPDGRVGIRAVAGDSIVFTVPIHTESMSNARLHWTAKAKKVQAQRRATAYRTPPTLKALGPLLVVTLVRVSPRELDDDNLRGALKGVRDQVATALGVDDRSCLVRWEYGQEKGEPLVRVEVSADVAKAARSVEERVAAALLAWEKSRGGA